jgi:hypothetical protein
MSNVQTSGKPYQGMAGNCQALLTATKVAVGWNLRRAAPSIVKTLAGSPLCDSGKVKTRNGIEARRAATTKIGAVHESPVAARRCAHTPFGHIERN